MDDQKKNGVEVLVAGVIKVIYACTIGAFKVAWWAFKKGLGI